MSEFEMGPRKPRHTLYFGSLLKTAEEQAVLDAALAWEEKRAEDWAGNATVRARLVLLDAIRAYRAPKGGT